MEPERITNKQLEILILLYRFRFLSTNHLKFFLNHNNHSLIGRYLRDLTQRNIVRRIYSTTRENINNPAVYYLGNKSIPLLTTKYSDFNPNLINKIYREKTSSEGFAKRCQFLADLNIHFQQAAATENTSLSFYTAVDLSDVAYTPLPLPDAYIISKDKGGSTRYFLDYFEPRLPMKAIRRKVERYFEYFEDNYWQDHNKEKFPVVLLVCSLPRVEISLHKFITQKLDEYDADISFFLTQKADIDRNGITGETWEAA